MSNNFHNFPNISSHFKWFSACSSHFQLFKAVSSIFQPFTDISSHLQPFTDIYSHLQPNTDTASYFQLILANSSLYSYLIFLEWLGVGLRLWSCVLRRLLPLGANGLQQPHSVKCILTLFFFMFWGEGDKLKAKDATNWWVVFLLLLQLFWHNALQCYTRSQWLFWES